MTFTKEQLDDMVHDAQRLSDEYSTGFYADEQVQDVALHVKALAAEVERLQRIATSETERCMDLEAIVDRLPKTADGVRVTPGMTVWHCANRSYGPATGGLFAHWGLTARMSTPYCLGEHCHYDGCQGDDGGGRYVEYGDCYSTREAAESARKANP